MPGAAAYSSLEGERRGMARTSRTAAGERRGMVAPGGEEEGGRARPAVENL